MEFTSEILQSLAKRAWKLVWVLVLNIIISLVILGFFVVHLNLYSFDAIMKIDSNALKIATFIIQNILWSLILYAIFFILKGDSDQTIKKFREKYYDKAIDRVKSVFEYRYHFPQEKYDKKRTLQKITEYSKEYQKEGVSHTISLKNVKTFIVSGVDSLYIIYNINSKESILFSIWHSGDFVAIAVAIKSEHIVKNIVEKEIEDKYKNILNLSASKESGLSKRNNFWWFDVKYEVSEEFLFNNIEQEKVSRAIAHIVTVGLSPSLELIGWEKV
jgi:hypothetical protein